MVARRVDPASAHVPVDRAGQMAGAQVVEGVALGRVALAQVVRKRPPVAGVTGGQGFQGAPGADRNPSSHTFFYRKRCCEVGEEGFRGDR